MLESWTPGTDFATLVEVVMHQAENLPAHKKVTLEDLDAALCELAANSGSPAPQMQHFRTKRPRHRILEPILKRLSSKEAKWLMRMLLKSYEPATIPEQTILRSFHFLLPDLLAIQNSFEAAIETLNHEALRKIPPDPPVKDGSEFRQLAAKCILPKLGVMIQHQPYDKGRSINHCYNMADRRTMSVERKYDGEFCQIHINMCKPLDQRIQIFSKSGKDSTVDRGELHWAIEQSLQLDDVECKIKLNCILEGELLVWSRSEEKIQPFYEIRKHVLHGGRRIGTAADSPRNKDDNLIIMYYDLLHLNNESWLNAPLKDRRLCLESVVNQMKGVGMVGTRNVINFGLRDAQKALCDLFVHSINQRWEGLVLKSVQDSYFSWERRPRVIKLKPDYVTGLSPSVDLCIVGGFREQLAVDQLAVGDLSWTSFYLACFDNKDEVEELQALPKFRVVDVLTTNCITKADLIHLNREGQYRRINGAETHRHFTISFERKLDKQGAQFFRKPFVVEVKGAGFDKPSDAAYFTLRFPRVKLHLDRTYVNTSSFDELQATARGSFELLSDSDTDDVLQRILKANGKHTIVDEGWSQETSRETAGTSTASTRGRPNYLPTAHAAGNSRAPVRPIGDSHPTTAVRTEELITPPPLNRQPPGSKLQPFHPKRTEPQGQVPGPDEEQDPYIGSTRTTYLPLSEMLNPPESRGLKRTLQQEIDRETAQTTGHKRRKGQSGAAVRRRGGASSPAMLNPTPVMKRLQSTVPVGSRSREVAVHVLAHICRTPSPDAADSISQILTSHWCLGTDNRRFGGRSRCGCPNCKLILIIAADESKLDDIAIDLKKTSVAVADIRRQALEKMAVRSKFINLMDEGGGQDQKLVIFLLKSAKTAISAIEKQLNAMPNAYEGHTAQLNKVFKDHFAGSIHFSFPKPFFSPTMALSVLQGAKESPGFAIQDVNETHARFARVIASGLPMQSTRSETRSATVQGSTSEVKVEWKWSRVCKLMSSLGCDTAQV